MLFHCRKEVQREMFLRKEAFKCCCCTSGSFGHTCACNASPGALCVVGLWLRLCTVLVLKSAHLSLTRSTDPHRPLSHTHTHTPTHTHPYIPDGQITEHRKTICNRGSITHKHRHPTLQGQECFRSLFSICLSLTLTRGERGWNQLRPLVAHHSSKAVF